MDGLRALLSAYGVNVAQVATGEIGRKRAWVISLDYTRDAFDVKSEYGQVSAFGDTTESWYAQAAYTLNDSWAAFLRRDYITTLRASRNDPSFYQRASVVGLGYTINDHLGLRLETHFNNGYAMPVASGDLLAGTGQTRWRMTAVSLNFLF